ncbi:phosphoadenylyl-sulfate reductase [Aliivibrio kagoshimensis]|uniref:phosphoadenylyl-sulfate reductase n=1 Tax=Aliivibrio kagoshimensis TaxID=2910230 RepID=UPI003D09D4E7
MPNTLFSEPNNAVSGSDNQVTKLTLDTLLSLNKVDQILTLAQINAELEEMTAQQRITWALENLDGVSVVSSSFGIQAAVMLKLVTDAQPEIPVVLTDTGYLFPETYQFIDELSDTLQLNLQVFRAKESPVWQEARYGQLWDNGVQGIKQYNLINKVEPMRRAFEELNVSVWFSGLRREQSNSRATLPILAIQNGVFKFLPIIDWSNKDVHHYLEQAALPYHPLREQGYLSVGDTHTTQKWEPGMSEEQTRFFGLQRECGLHEDPQEEAGSGI